MTSNLTTISINPSNLGDKCKVNTLCRLCLNSSSNKIEIFGAIGRQINISGTIGVLFNSQVIQDDCWPQSICMPCCEKLTEFHGFYNIVKSTEATLIGLCGGRDVNEPYPVMVEEKFSPEDENIEYLEDQEDEESHEFEEVSVKLEKILLEPPKRVDIVEEHKEDDTPIAMRKHQGNKKQKNPENLPESASKRESLNASIRKFVNLSCELCSMAFTLFEDIKRHYREHHNTVGYVRCCNTRFEKRQRLVEHIHYHEDPKSFECYVCAKIFKFRNHLQEHLHTHIPPEKREFKCDQCPKSYTKYCRLIQHQKAHVPHEQREHICPQCSKAFASIYVMRSHIKIVHERVQKRVCEYCARVFNTKEAFVAHQVNHMEEKPPKVQCEYCGKKFKQRPGLLRHMLRHKNPNQVFSCDVCGKNAATKRALHMHKKYVHSSTPLKCNLCDKEFKRPINLKEHMASHTGQQQLYNCNFCDKMFNSNANRYTHQKRKHPEEWDEARRKKME